MNTELKERIILWGENKDQFNRMINSIPHQMKEKYIKDQEIKEKLIREFVNYIECFQSLQPEIQKKYNHHNAPSLYYAYCMTGGFFMLEPLEDYIWDMCGRLGLNINKQIGQYSRPDYKYLNYGI